MIKSFLCAIGLHKWPVNWKFFEVRGSTATTDMFLKESRTCERCELYVRRKVQVR